MRADRFDGVPSTPATQHRYLYAQDDPVNRRDPSGLFGFGYQLVGWQKQPERPRD